MHGGPISVVGVPLLIIVSLGTGLLIYITYARAQLYMYVTSAVHAGPPGLA